MADQKPKEETKEATAPSAAAGTLATTKNETIDVVTAKVRQFATNGELHFPPDYSPENALKSAWLVLQETVDKDKKPVLAVCSRASIANALLNMVVQGLNVAKKQGYFIAYGQTLTFQRSYFGTMALAIQNSRDPIEEIFAQPIYEGDEFAYELVRGRRRVTKHIQQFENVDKAKVRGAYCTICYSDGREVSTIMTLDEIKQAWRQSQMKPVLDNGNLKPDSTHAKFTAEMACKTVVNRACKPIINSSNDSSLVLTAVRESDQDVIEAQVIEEIEEGANDGEIIAVPHDALPSPEEGVACEGRIDADSCHDCQREHERTGESCSDPRGPIGEEAPAGPDF
jgi:recombination protein RecT